MRIFSTKFLWTFAGVFLFSSLFAEKDGEVAYYNPGPAPTRTKMENMNQKIDAMNTRLDQISEKNMSGTFGGKNPPSRGTIGYYHVLMDLSLIYWSSYNHGFAFANETVGPSRTASGQGYQNIRMHEVKFDWSPGVRFGLGYNSCFDAWDFEAIWTWNRFNDSRHVSSKNYNPTNAIGLRPISYFDAIETAGYYPVAAGYWRLNYQTGDLEARRSFFITKALSCKAILGLRGASLAQRYKFSFDPMYLVGDDTPYLKFKSNSYYWGIGPRLGVDAKWTFPHNVGFTGLISGALLYGREKERSAGFESIVNDQEREPYLGPLEQVSEDHYHYNMIAPTVQIMLGLDWGMGLLRDTMYFGLNASWEFNYWWNQLHTSLIIQRTRAVEMQGVTINAELRF